METRMLGCQCSTETMMHGCSSETTIRCTLSKSSGSLTGLTRGLGGLPMIELSRRFQTTIDDWRLLG